MHDALQLYQRKRLTSTTATIVLYYWRLLIRSFSVGSEAMKQQVFFAGCRLKFHYNWKTAGTKKKGKAIDLP